MILLNISQFRNSMQKIISRLSEEQETLVLMVNGAPKVVMITVEEYNKLKGEDVISTKV